MPTALLRNRGKRKRAMPVPTAAGPDISTVLAGPKWEGHCPDLNHHLGDLQFCEDVLNLIPNDGALTVDSGFDYVEENQLPLGVDAAVAESPVSPFTDRQPIIGLFELIRQDTGSDRYLFAAATSLGIDAAATGTVGALFWWDTATPAWTEIPFDAGAGTAMASARANLYDWVFYPYAGTPVGGATEVPGIVVFTNNEDEVYKWDPGSGGAVPGEYGRLFNAPLGGAHPFYARSVELFDGRLVFLNTTENNGGALEMKLRRCRWTSIGSATPSLTAVGASFLDFEEFGDEGLRVLRFRDIAACYFRDGVGFIRRTGQATQPFIRQYVVKNRGLLAPRAVCRLTDDVHFGIFTDGWFLLDSSGNFTELGLDAQGNHKWKESFYQNLDQANLDHIVVGYDSFRHCVRVAWPRTDNSEDDSTRNEVWFWDMKTDTVWPQSGYQVTYFGETNVVLEEGTIIDDLGGTIDDLVGTIDSYSPVYGLRSVLFGDKNGYVYAFNPGESTKVGQTVDWEYSSFRRNAAGDLHTRATACRVDIEYLEQSYSGGATVAARNEVGDEDSTPVSFQGSGASYGNLASKAVHVHLAGKRHGVKLTGSGKPRIYSFALTTLPFPSDGREIE